MRGEPVPLSASLQAQILNAAPRPRVDTSRPEAAAATPPGAPRAPESPAASEEPENNPWDVNARVLKTSIEGKKKVAGVEGKTGDELKKALPDIQGEALQQNTREQICAQNSDGTFILSPDDLVAPLRRNLDKVVGDVVSRDTPNLLDNSEITAGDSLSEARGIVDRLGEEHDQYAAGLTEVRVQRSVAKPGKGRLSFKERATGKVSSQTPEYTTESKTIKVYNPDVAPAVAKAKSEAEGIQAELTAKQGALETYIEGQEPSDRVVGDSDVVGSERNWLNAVVELEYFNEALSQSQDPAERARLTEEITDRVDRIAARQIHKKAKSVLPNTPADIAAYLTAVKGDSRYDVDYVDQYQGIFKLQLSSDQATDTLDQARSQAMRWYETDELAGLNQTEGWKLVDTHGEDVTIPVVADKGKGWEELDRAEAAEKSSVTKIVAIEVLRDLLSKGALPDGRALGAMQKGREVAVDRVQRLKTIEESVRILEEQLGILDPQLIATLDASVAARTQEADDAVASALGHLRPMNALAQASKMVESLPTQGIVEDLGRMGINIDGDMLKEVSASVGQAVESAAKDMMQEGAFAEEGSMMEMYARVMSTLNGEQPNSRIKPRVRLDSGTPAAGGAPLAGETPPSIAPTPDVAAQAEAERIAAAAEAARVEKEEASRELATGLDDQGSDFSWKDKFDAEEALAKDEARVRAYLNPADKKALAGLIRAASKSNESFNAVIGQLDAQDPRRIILENMRMAGLSSSQMVKRANEIFDQFAKVKSALGMLSYLCATLGLPMLQRDEAAGQAPGGAPTS